VDGGLAARAAVPTLGTRATNPWVAAESGMEAEEGTCRDFRQREQTEWRPAIRPQASGMAQHG
jgi:hypothetical protein